MGHVIGRARAKNRGAPEIFAAPVRADALRAYLPHRQWPGSRSGARWLGAQRSRVAEATRKQATPSSGFPERDRAAAGGFWRRIVVARRARCINIAPLLAPSPAP